MMFLEIVAGFVACVAMSVVSVYVTKWICRDED